MRWNKQTMLKHLNRWAKGNGYKPISSSTLDHWRKKQVVAPPQRISLKGQGTFRDWAGAPYDTARRIMKLRVKDVAHYRKQRLHLALVGKAEFIPLKQLGKDFRSEYKSFNKNFRRKAGTETLVPPAPSQGKLGNTQEAPSKSILGFLSLIPKDPSTFTFLHLLEPLANKKFYLEFLRHALYPPAPDEQKILENRLSEQENQLSRIFLLILPFLPQAFPFFSKNEEKFISLVEQVFHEAETSQDFSVLIKARDLTYLTTRFFLKIFHLLILMNRERSDGTSSEKWSEILVKFKKNSEEKNSLELSIIFFPVMLWVVKINDPIWNQIQTALSVIVPWLDQILRKPLKLSSIREAQIPGHFDPLVKQLFLLFGLEMKDNAQSVASA